MIKRIVFVILCYIYEVKWHFDHWLIIFTSYPKQFPATKDLTNLECSLWHKEQFYEYLSWGINQNNFFQEVENAIQRNVIQE